LLQAACPACRQAGLTRLGVGVSIGDELSRPEATTLESLLHAVVAYPGTWRCSGKDSPLHSSDVKLHVMSLFPVSPEKEAQLAQRMVSLGVREGDIAETFVRSGGHGGQNVNKTSTCVMLLHRPTGLQVKCQSTRQQGLNRFIARRLLLDKIEMLRKGYVDAKRAIIEKIRRQKRKRSRRARDRMLADKSHHAAKKESRRSVALD
jgi:hypothetical protein